MRETRGLSVVLARVLGARLPIRLASVAAILDKFGGVRVVVTDEDRTFQSQLAPGRDEQIYITPGHLEPMYAYSDGAARDDGVPRPLWNRSAVIISNATAHLESKMPSQCGSCRVCCITPYVAKDRDGFSKPSHTPCHNLCGAGCKRYAKRPRTCVEFKCVWLKSQNGNRPMEYELRPDRANAMLTDIDEGPIRIHVPKGKDISDRMKMWLQAMEAEGDHFERVRYYYGEQP